MPKRRILKLSFDRKRILFFVFLGVLGLFGWLFWVNMGRQAAISFADIPLDYLASQKVTNIEIQQDGNVLLDGVKHNEAIRLYSEYDELRIKLYDNSGEFIPMLKVIVHLPKEVNEDEIQQKIYAVHGAGENRSYIADAKTLIYEVDSIAPTSTVTIVAYLPKGLIKPNFWQLTKYYLTQVPLRNWLYIASSLPILTLFLMIFMTLKRRKSQLIPVRGLLGGPPEVMPPAIPGVLIDGVVGAREIAATLIDLARRGYIFIINKGNGEFSFGARRINNIETEPGLSPFEKELLAKIFLPHAVKSTVADVEMRIGRHIFSRKIARFYLGIYNEATKRGYFIENPAKVHLAWKYTGIVLFFTSFIGFIIGAVAEIDPKFSLLFWVGGMLAATVMIRFAPYMPARTREGSEELQEWLEFREFLTDNKPATGVMQLEGKFEEYLPYAIVLGAEVNWAKRFLNQRFNKPDWYETNEQAVTLESFASQIFPLIGYVAKNLARSHEPTVE